VCGALMPLAIAIAVCASVAGMARLLTGIAGAGE
jgi:hypothetical protein